MVSSFKNRDLKKSIRIMYSYGNEKSNRTEYYEMKDESHQSHLTVNHTTKRQPLKLFPFLVFW